MTTLSTSEAAATGLFARHEGRLVVGFAILLLAANLLTTLLYPTCWMDEVMFADPAIHAVRGEGLVSTAWWQSKDITWSGNVPLYTCALVPWFKIVGVSLARARAFNYGDISLTLVIFWLAVRRLNWVVTPGARVALMVTAFLSYPMCMPYRSARPDCLGMLICAMALLAWTWRAGGWRNAALFLLGALAPASGLQLVAYMGFICALVFWVQGRSVMFPAGCVLAGLVAGLAALCLFYFVNHLDGVWETFLQARRIHAASESAGQGGELSFAAHWLIKLKHICLDHLKDKGIFPALIALGVLPWDRAVRADRKALWPLAIAVVASVLIVAALEIGVHYLDYYHWMNFIILMLAGFAVVSRKWRDLTRFTRCAVTLSLLGMTLAGLPLRVTVGCALGQSEEFAQMQEAVRRNINSNDVVFSDFMGYFPARERAREVYLPPYFNALSDLERQSVNVLILDPINFEGYKAEFSRDGQHWKMVAVVPAQSGRLAQMWLKLFPNFRAKPTNSGYGVSILRREPEAATVE